MAEYLKPVSHFLSLIYFRMNANGFSFGHQLLLLDNRFIVIINKTGGFGE